MRILITDFHHDADLERNLFTIAGLETVVAQCHTPEEVIASTDRVDVIMTASAPISEAVFAAFPDLKMITTYAGAVDHVDLEAAKLHRVWVSNVPHTTPDPVESEEEGKRKAVINVLSWWKDGRAPNAIVKGKKGTPLT